jgi:methyltransferase (TIGR00027 family)
VTESAPVLPPVSETAVGVAAVRAAESTAPGRLFTDPLAASFVRASGWTDHRPDDVEALRHRTSLITWITVRTRFLDDVVLDACAQGCRQVVILGAGLDARAFRLGWPEGVRLWELDLPDVLAFKEQVLRAESAAPSCERATVPIDLTDDWGRSLRAAGFDEGAPVAWLAEGLLAYLRPEAANALVTRAAGLSVAGSRLGLTLASPERLRSWQQAHPDGTSDARDYVALWRSAAPAEAAGWLDAHGWDATVYDVAERAAAYGRPTTDAADHRAGARLVDAVRHGPGGTDPTD